MGCDKQHEVLLPSMDKRRIQTSISISLAHFCLFSMFWTTLRDTQGLFMTALRDQAWQGKGDPMGIWALNPGQMHGMQVFYPGSITSPFIFVLFCFGGQTQLFLGVNLDTLLRNQIWR